MSKYYEVIKHLLESAFSIHECFRDEISIIVEDNKILTFSEKGYQISESPVQVTKYQGLIEGIYLTADNQAVAMITDLAMTDNQDIYSFFLRIAFCYVMNNGAAQAAEKLGLTGKFAELPIYYYETEYQFDYDDSKYLDNIKHYHEALDAMMFNVAREYRYIIFRSFTRKDIQYMMWIEWKYGYAKYIANRVMMVLHLDYIEEKPDEKDPYYFVVNGAKLIEVMIFSMTTDGSLSGIYDLLLEV